MRSCERAHNCGAPIYLILVRPPLLRHPQKYKSSWPILAILNWLNSFHTFLVPPSHPHGVTMTHGWRKSEQVINNWRHLSYKANSDSGGGQSHTSICLIWTSVNTKCQIINQKHIKCFHIQVFKRIILSCCAPFSNIKRLKHPYKLTSVQSPMY